ncbi:MAG: DEAD/DEAH box helicase [Leptolyngbyaceae cyanobacterium CSU_1_4]|nr:DEAD/DEAH box helicase [Leptolyngbyaceae cyanobacterium CSU_1_4]
MLDELHMYRGRQGADVALFEVKSGAIALSVVEALLEGLEALELALDGWFDPILQVWDEIGYNALLEAFEAVDIEYFNDYCTAE